MIRFFRSPWWILLWGVQPFFLNAQTDLALLREVAEENKKSVEALALYPEDARLAMLEAAKYPEVLVKMQGIQQKTKSAFRTLLEDFPRAQQEIFYDLTRFPGLIENLIARQGDGAGRQEALAVFPEEKRGEVAALVDRYSGVLVKINDLNHTTAQAFERLIGAYPAPAQAAFRKLLDLPEVLVILNEDLRLTVLVGDIYKEDPAWVIHKMDSLNSAVARAHAEELEAWKKTLESDPGTREELREAASEYAADQGYDDPEAAHEQDEALAHRHYYYPYSWWYGYPWWHPYPYWRPYPWWWDWGWYWQPAGIVVIYLPSYHFVHWYFDHPGHHRRYNHLSAHFVRHYYGWRRSGTGISAGVGQWRNQNREILSDDWFADKARLPERLREYGRFEENRRIFNQNNPGRTATPGEYLQKNAQKYPELERSRTRALTEMERETERNGETPPHREWAPAKEPVKTEPAPERPPRVSRAPKTGTEPQKREENPKQPGTPPARVPAPETRKPAAEKPSEPRRKEEDNTSDARDYHRQKWDEGRSRESQPPPSKTPSPAPRTKTPPPQRTRGGGN